MNLTLCDKTVNGYIKEKKKIVNSHLGEWRASHILDFVTSNSNILQSTPMNSQIRTYEASNNHFSVSQ